jgi:hypothetical protein
MFGNDTGLAEMLAKQVVAVDGINIQGRTAGNKSVNFVAVVGLGHPEKDVLVTFGHYEKNYRYEMFRALNISIPG